MKIPELLNAAGIAKRPWESAYMGTIYGLHVGEHDGGPCRIGMFDNQEAADLAVAAVNALPAHLKAIDGLRQAISVLENYGDHHGWCGAVYHRCTCGFDLELANLRAALEAAE